MLNAHFVSSITKLTPILLSDTGTDSHGLVGFQSYWSGCLVTKKTIDILF